MNLLTTFGRKEHRSRPPSLKPPRVKQTVAVWRPLQTPKSEGRKASEQR